MVNLNELNRLKNGIYSEINNVINEMRREGETDFYNPLKEYYDAYNSIGSLQRVENKLNVEINNLKSQVDELKKELLNKSSGTEVSERFNQIVTQKEQELEELNRKHTEICTSFVEVCQEKDELEKKVRDIETEIESIKSQHQVRILNFFRTSISNLAEQEQKTDEWEEIARDLADEVQLLQSAQKFLIKKAIRTQKLEQQKQFLIKKSVELASYKTQADKLQGHLGLARQDIETLTGQITYWQTQDDQLRNTIQSLQAQITQLQKEKKSLIKQKGTAQQRAQQLRKDSRTNHESWQEKYDLLEQENIQLTDNHQELEQKLLRKIGRLVKEQEKNQKLTKTKRAKALLAQKLRTDLNFLTGQNTYWQNQDASLRNTITRLQTDLNQTQTSLSTLLGQRDDLYFQLAQFNTTNQSLQSANQQLEQEKTDLNNRLTDKDSLITSLTTEQSQFKEQIQQDYNQLQSSYNSLNDKNQTQAQTIQQLEQQHRQFEEQKQQWKQRERQLLAEIEFLKNPPRQANKENILVETENQQLREQIKELDQKLPAEKIRAINLILAEQRNRFNQQLEQKDSQARERERESVAFRLSQRRSERAIWWMLLIILLAIVIGQTVLLVRKRTRIRKKLTKKKSF